MSIHITNEGCHDCQWLEKCEIEELTLRTFIDQFDLIERASLNEIMSVFELLMKKRMFEQYYEDKELYGEVIAKQMLFYSYIPKCRKAWKK